MCKHLLHHLHDTITVLLTSTAKAHESTKLVFHHLLCLFRSKWRRLRRIFNRWSRSDWRKWRRSKAVWSSAQWVLMGIVITKHILSWFSFKFWYFLFCFVISLLLCYIWFSFLSVFAFLSFLFFLHLTLTLFISVQVSAEKEMKESDRLFASLIRSIKERQTEVNAEIEEKQKAAERRSEELINELQQEINELQRRNGELEELRNSDDHLHLLQVTISLKLWWNTDSFHLGGVRKRLEDRNVSEIHPLVSLFHFLKFW